MSLKTLLITAKSGIATERRLFPDLAAYSRGLPMVTDEPCSTGCSACADVCPTQAIRIDPTGSVSIDRGLCLACGECAEGCPTKTITEDRSTRVAELLREDLVVTSPSRTRARSGEKPAIQPFRRSLHIRAVSTGDNASDLEVGASDNPIFDVGRFGIHIVASPRFADALVVTGPVARAMRDPLLRCYEAMASPRLVIAVGTAAISGGIYRGGYAEAEGVSAILPVNAYVPGNPPHPWYILHGLLLAMGREAASARNGSTT